MTISHLESAGRIIIVVKAAHAGPDAANHDLDTMIKYCKECNAQPNNIIIALSCADELEQLTAREAIEASREWKESAGSRWTEVYKPLIDLEHKQAQEGADLDEIRSEIEA